MFSFTSGFLQPGVAKLEIGGNRLNGFQSNDRIVVTLAKARGE